METDEAPTTCIAENVSAKGRRGRRWSVDMRWRCVILRYMYSVPVQHIEVLLGVSIRSIRRFLSLFNKNGDVFDGVIAKRSRYTPEVLKEIECYVSRNPTFYVEELQDWLRSEFPNVQNISESTLCRALRHDMGYSRKVNSYL
jgi:hypothetical protein